MAIAIITIIDNEEDRTVTVNVNFGENGTDDTSAAHAAACVGVKAALEWLKGGDSNG